MHKMTGETSSLIVAAAINNPNAASTGISTFFFTYSYNIDPVATEGKNRHLKGRELL